MKYVILRTDAIEDVPVVFPEMADHSSVAHGKTVVSAGFISVNWETLRATAYGKSVSLGVASRPEDSRILTKLLFPKD